MSKELHIALQNAIGDLGTDVLRSPFLVNILQDYGAFDVHDKGSLAIKQRLAEFVNDGIVEEIASWEKMSDKKAQSKGLSLLMRYNNTDDVRIIIDSILKSCGLPNLSILQSNETQSKPLTPQQSTLAANSNTYQTQHSKNDSKISGKNVVCAVVSLIIALVLITFAILMIIGGNWDAIEDIVWTSVLGVVFFVVGVIGPFTNSDFWK